MTQFPIPPFLTIGEILYQITILGDLAQTSNDKDPLYNDLKAFKDDRKRPGLRPRELMDSVLPNIEDRLTIIWEIDSHEATRAMIAAISCGLIEWFDMYTELVANTDASLLTRDQMLKEVLWPTYFSAGVVILMGTLNKFRPFANLEALVTAESPLGWYLKTLCCNGSSDFNQIAKYRASKNNIDEKNARQTFETWLNGTVPNLKNSYEVLEALNMKDDLGKRFGIFISRILQKIPIEFRLHIKNQLLPRPDTYDIRVEARRLIKNISWKVGSQLNIAKDRPYPKIRSALYEEFPGRPGSMEIIDMLERQERTWEPIKDHTMHVIHWLWGRFYVLKGEYEKALERYVLAYNYGANRDPEIYTYAIPEALILAAKLGKTRQVKRFNDWLGFYYTSEWDEQNQSIDDRFEELFPQSLRLI